MPSPVKHRHEGKIAIITGAGQGIGLGIAQRLAAEGAISVIAEINSETCATAAQQIEAAGGSAWAYPFDARSIDQIEALVPAVVARYGRIDMLINNAGINDPQPLLESTAQAWDAIFEVNVRGLYFCTQIIAEQMLKQAPAEGARAGIFGRIVNLASVAGRKGRGSNPAYAAAKATVISVTQAAAAYLAPYGINVNAVCPGIVPTAMWDLLDRVEGARHGLPSGEWFRRRVQRIPQLRHCTVEDVAAAVSFLCSDDADHITGQALNVDGGIEMN